MALAGYIDHSLTIMAVLDGLEPPVGCYIGCLEGYLDDSRRYIVL